MFLPGFRYFTLLFMLYFYSNFYRRTCKCHSKHLHQ